MNVGWPSAVPASTLTRRALIAMLVVVAATCAFLLVRYPSLPWLLPVHFTRSGTPDGWQYKTLGRVLMPSSIQVTLYVTLCVTLGGIALLLLSRRDGRVAREMPDAQAAVAAAEAVVLMALVWVAFQAYAATALVRMWTTERSTLGAAYTMTEVVGLVATGVIGARAQARLGRPAPVAFVPGHWRLGRLYCNAAHPALFVPTRDGSKWTLNFGRPAAAILLGGLVTVGIVLPTVILALALRS